MTLQSRIREAVQAALDRGLSKADIARQAGVSAAAVTQWLTGDTKSLKAESAAGLESATGFRAVWIITGKGGRFPESGWPFGLFNEADYKLLDEQTRRDIEDSIAGKIQRARLTRGNGTSGRSLY